MRDDRSKLYLITGKGVRKKYDTLHVKLCDESWFEFNLNECKVTMIDHDWLEIARLDETTMQWFAMQNILIVTFTSSKAKIVAMEKPELKPVA